MWLLDTLYFCISNPLSFYKFSWLGYFSGGCITCWVISKLTHTQRVVILVAEQYIYSALVLDYFYVLSQGSTWKQYLSAFYHVFFPQKQQQQQRKKKQEQESKRRKNTEDLLSSFFICGQSSSD